MCGAPRARPADWTNEHEEERLKRLRHANVTLLRPVSFCENFSDQLGVVEQQGGSADLQYVQLSDSDMIAALVESGYSVSFAMLYVEMTRAFNEGTVKPRQGRLPANTTRTRFEDFAGELVSYRSAAGINRLCVLRAGNNQERADGQPDGW